MKTSDAPEVLILTFPKDTQTSLRSIEGNLLERGISFRTVDVDDLGTVGAIAWLDRAGKAAFIANDLLERIRAEDVWREAMQRFARRNGYLAPYGNKPEALSRGWLKSVIDSTLAAVAVEEAVAYAGLTTQDAAFRQERIERDPSPLFAAEYAELLKWLERAHHPSEWHMHRGKAAEALILAGDLKIAERYLAVTKEYFQQSHDYFYDDQYSAFMAPVALARAGVDDSLLSTAHEQLKAALERRPKKGRFRSYVGYADEPLKGLSFVERDSQISGVNLGFGGHDCVSNEMIHFTATVLVSVGVACGDEDLIGEGVALCEHVYRIHKMPNGLLHHVSQGEEARGAAWGRGQTHAIYGLIYCLDALPADSVAHASLRKHLVAHLEASLPHQDEETGLWRNVIDAPAARPESSCTVGITIALARALGRGWMPRAQVEPVIDRACNGIRSMMHAGALGAFCRGTYAGGGEVHYLARPQGWGPAPQMILLGTELHWLGKIARLPG